VRVFIREGGSGGERVEKCPYLKENRQPAAKTMLIGPKKKGRFQVGRGRRLKPWENNYTSSTPGGEHTFSIPAKRGTRKKARRKEKQR